MMSVDVLYTKKHTGPTRVVAFADPLLVLIREKGPLPWFVLRTATGATRWLTSQLESRNTTTSTRLWSGRSG